MPRIALIGEFDPTFAPHVATAQAVEHSAALLGASVDAEWLCTAALDRKSLEQYDAVWVAPGSPYRSLERALDAIRYAREEGVPCLGTCGGFQHVILEYARHVLGYTDAQHAEYDPYASNLFISSLACSLAGRDLPLRFVDGSRVAQLYGAQSATESYYCNFAVSTDKVPLLTSGSLQVTGSDAEGEIRVVELPAHPFFLATLFVPQTRSTAAQPHPIVTGFLRAAMA
ncbi:MAG: hypothetical protein SFW08_02305 [Gemmatimonadaceae bacterium]|nr:hypothetical protein [Gemmatimonadaceae bacterium]